MKATMPPRVDARAVRRLIERLARADAAPWLHREVARQMAERLQLLRQVPRDWLDWWGFLGGGAPAVAAIWPDALRWVAEPTAALVERSRQACVAPWWMRLRAGDARRRVVPEPAVAPGSVQMVWANMMLHWSGDPAQTIADWHRALEPDGWLMFSTFGPQTLRELRAVYAEAGWSEPHVPFTDMHDLGDMLVRGGFADPVMDQQTLTLTWSSPQSALAELRALGANVSSTRASGLRTPRWRARLHAALQARAAADGRVALGFEVVFGHARRALARRATAGEVTIDTAALRGALRRRRGTAA